MKHIKILIITIASCYSTYAQTNLVALTEQDTLLISDVKTTHLLFSDDIKYLDIGSPYFVADTLQQIIRLKHIGEELEDTRSQISNLTVITKNGAYYSIALGYNRFAYPETFKVKKSSQIISIFKQEEAIAQKKEDEFVSLCDQMEKTGVNVRIKNKKEGDLRIEITGIFYIQEKIAIRIALRNESTIDFDIDHILFRTKLYKRFSKDYLYQERVISPLYTCTDDFEIIGEGRGSITLLFDKFMLNEKEKLAIDIFEENGGRSATIDIPRKKLLQPKII